MARTCPVWRGMPHRVLRGGHLLHGLMNGATNHAAVQDAVNVSAALVVLCEVQTAHVCA